MPNETPKSKCCDAPPRVHIGGEIICSACKQMFVYREQETPSKKQIARQCTCGLQAHPQPNCSADKQPNDMPDVVYLAYSAARINSVKYEHIEQSPYIRKSIHDEQKADLLLKWGKSDEVYIEQITKLKSALKECVEALNLCSCFCSSPYTKNCPKLKAITS